MIIVEKVIFLDIDGVLNSEKWSEKFWEYTHSKGRLSVDINDSIYDKFSDLSDPEATDLLIDVLNKTGAYIVLSSSWRSWTYNKTIQEFSTFRHIPFRKLVPYIVGVTSRSDGPIRLREKEIQKFVDDIKSNTINPLIVDDNVRFLEDFKWIVVDDDNLNMQHFVRTNYETGFGEKEAKQIIEILGEKKYESNR